MTDAIERLKSATQGMGARNPDDYVSMFSVQERAEIFEHIYNLKIQGRKLKALTEHLCFAISNLSGVSKCDLHDLLGKALAIANEPMPDILVEHKKSRSQNIADQMTGKIGALKIPEEVFCKESWKLGIIHFIEQAMKLKDGSGKDAVCSVPSYQPSETMLESRAKELLKASKDGNNNVMLTVSEQLQIADYIARINKKNLMLAARNSLLADSIKRIEGKPASAVKRSISEAIDKTKTSLEQSFDDYNAIQDRNTITELLSAAINDTDFNKDEFVAPLVVGQRYLAVQPEYEDEVNDEPVRFPETRILFEVQKKPSKVVSFDGYEKRMIPLPKHLSRPEWYRAVNLETNKPFWLHAPNYKITPD